MKKLMILGGSRYILPVIEAAHKLGIYVITADYLPGNIAHKYSDEYVNVSIIDKKATLKEAQKRNIDGITSFACDPGVTTMAYVAEKMGLPCVGSYDAVCILQNKAKFRQFLRENGFNSPMSKGYTSISDALKDIKIFSWPVIVKPTDSAGSKGVMKVERPEDLSAAAKNALSFSHSGEFIVEDFITQKGCSSDCDCFSVDGKLEVATFSAQRFDKNAENPYTPSMYTWPATLSAESTSILKQEIQRLITLLGLKTSIYNLEVREDINGKPYIMEFSPRGGGNRLAEVIRMSQGTDMITNAVKAVVGLPLGEFQFGSQGFWAEVILHSVHAGRFVRLDISDNVKPIVADCDLWVKQGDAVGAFRGANEAIGTLILKFDSREQLERFVDRQDECVKVVTENEDSGNA